MENYRTDAMDRLYRALSLLNDEESCRSFLEDLCTIRELQDMAQRFETALLLDKGEHYQKISERLGVSTATITRVNRSFTYGSGGYQTAIDRLRETEEKHESGL